METVKTRVNVPNDRHLLLDLRIPESVPAGAADVVLIFQSPKSVTPQLFRSSGHPNQVRITDTCKHAPDAVRFHGLAKLNVNILKMIANGQVQWSGKKPAGMSARVLSKGKSIADAVIEDRRWVVPNIQW